MTVREDMLNGHDICHGGFIATLADSAFAYACNSYNELTVACGLHRRLPGPGAARRRADRALRRGVEGRPHRRLRCRGQQPARRAGRGVPRPLVHDQGQAGGRFRSCRAIAGRPGCRTRRCRGDSHAREATRPRRPRADRDRQPRRDRGAAAAAPAATLQHAYDNVAALPQGVRCARACKPGGPEVAGRPAQFPFTTKEDLRDNYPFGMFAVPREQVARIHASSGTTGKPTVVGYTPTTSTSGPTWWRARSAPPAAAPATSCTWPTATACSPAASARTTAPSAPAAP